MRSHPGEGDAAPGATARALQQGATGTVPGRAGPGVSGSRAFPATAL